MVENVEKIAISQRKTLDTTTSDGNRYARHARRRKTSRPTMSSEISRRPRKSATEAASQCAVSARGTIVLRRREIGDEAGGYEDREHETDEDDEQRPLEDVVVEIAAAIPVEDEDAIGLRHAPDEAGKDREGSQQLKHERPPWTALDARLLSF